MRILAVAVCLLLAGCAGSGFKTETGNPNITLENIKKIEKGKTTQAQITAMFGDPIAKSQSSMGDFWTYTHSINTMTDQGFFGPGVAQDIRSISLIVIFNPNGIVSDYSSTEVNPMQNVKASTF